MNAPALSATSLGLFRRLTKEDAPRYQTLTFPGFRAALALERSCALAAEKEGIPLGLALGFFPEDQPDVANLLSLFVEPGARRQGIGSELLARFEEAARAEEKRFLRVTYMTGKPGVETLERLLAKNGWGAPHARMLVVKSTIPIIQAAPWMQLPELPPRWQISPWSEVTAEDRAALRAAQLEKSWIPEELVPFDHEENYDVVTSLAMRFEGEIVGWVVNHQMGPKLIRFTCAYMRPDFQRLGRILWLYAESVRRMERHGYFEGMWTIPVKHRAYVLFARRWMAPYSSFFGETRGAEKSW